MAERNYSKTEGRQNQSGIEGSRTARIAAAVLLLGFVVGPYAAPFESAASMGVDLVISQIPHRPGHQLRTDGRFSYSKEREQSGRIILLTSGGESQVLTQDFLVAADPTVSFDGKRILFAGRKRTTEPWNIWEMDVDGKNKRQITKDQGNCLEPRYLATSSITPPDFSEKVRWITFLSDQANAPDPWEQGPSLALYAQNIEPIEGRGTVIRRSTFNPASEFSPAVISDGRILYTSRQSGDSGRYPNGRFPILACNWDGTGLNLFYSDDENGLVKSMACESPDRTLVFVESGGETPDGSGALVRVSFKRPLHSREILSRGGGLYRRPYALPDTRLLVSYTSGVEARGIYLFDFDKGIPGIKLHSDPHWDDQAAVAVLPRPEPQGLISAVVESEKTVDLQCLSVYDSDLPHVKALKPGDVKSIRFIEGLPPLPAALGRRLPLPDGLRFRARILGEAQVELDGSFFVTLPGDTPFYMQLLDREGMALQSMSTWVWGRRGTSRSCIGCHENREYAPENRVSQALLKIRPQVLLEPPETRRPIPDFQSIRPLVQKQCASCHGASPVYGKLDLSVSTAQNARKTFEALLKGRKAENGSPPYVLPGQAKNSPLIRRIFSGRDGAVSAGGHPAVDLSTVEMRTLIEWIDLGARWEN
jgi:hypothetical protein